jgi:hypothetical protein
MQDMAWIDGFRRFGVGYANWGMRHPYLGFVIFVATMAAGFMLLWALLGPIPAAIIIALPVIYACSLLVVQKIKAHASRR